MKRLVERDDPRVVFTEHLSGVATAPPLSQRGSKRRRSAVATALVVAVNTRDEPVACPIRVGGEVRRVWNGSLKDGILRIPANDGCAFEIEIREGK